MKTKTMVTKTSAPKINKTERRNIVQFFQRNIFNCLM